MDHRLPLSGLDDPEELRRLYESGMSMQAMADSFGCHRNTVRNRLIEYGIERRHHGAHFKGRSKPALQRQRMAEAARRRWQANPMTNEMRQKMSEGRRRNGRTSSPYVWIWHPEYGYESEHRIVMMESLGRPLTTDEHVHHVDHDPTNNAIENLRLVTPSEHAATHAPLRTRDSAGRWT